MIYERLEELDPAKFEVDAAKLLHGLGFGKTMMAKATKDMSGWQHKQIPFLYSQCVCWLFFAVLVLLNMIVNARQTAVVCTVSALYLQSSSAIASAPCKVM